LSIVYAVEYPSIQEWLSVMLPYKNLYTEGVDNFAAWVGFTALMLLWLFSLPYMQRTNFELFFVCHVGLAPVFILFATLHDYATLFFIQPALVTWVTDRILRRYSSERKIVVQHAADTTTTTTTLMTTPNSRTVVMEGDDLSFPSIQRGSGGGECTLSTVLGSSVVRLTLPIPSAWGHIIQPGTFLYLKDLSLSSWQSHPFSVLPTSGTGTDHRMTLHIKALGDWSTSLVKQVQDFIVDQQPRPPDTLTEPPRESTVQTDGCRTTATTTPTPAAGPLIHLELEGPYVSTLSHVLQGYRQCWFLAGGIGITGVADLCRICQQEGRPYHLVWLVRTPSELALLEHLLIPLHEQPAQSQQQAPYFDVTSNIQIFVTSRGDDPPPPETPPPPSTLTLSNPPPAPIPNVLSTKCQVSYGTSPITTVGGGHHPSHQQLTELSTMVTTCMSMALCFWVSRMISCNYVTGLDDDHNAERIHKCSFLTHTISCVSCEMGDEEEQRDHRYPCCTVGICFYSFRGIPIVLSFLVTPLVALFLLRVWSWTKTCLPWFHFYHQPVNVHDDDDDHVEDNVDQAAATPETLLSTTARYTTIPTPGSPHCPASRVMARTTCSHPNIQVEYGKPNLDDLLWEASTNHGGIIDDNNEEGRTAVVVCGSHSLVRDIIRRGNEQLRWKHVTILPIHGLPELPPASSCCYSGSGRRSNRNHNSDQGSG
jgi:FAD-binding domain